MTEEQAKKMYSQVPDYIKDFIRLIEGYYGKYSSSIVKCLIAMDMKDFTPEQLRELFDLVRKDYSNTYKTPPDTNRLIESWEKKFKQYGLKKVDNHYEDINGNVFDSDMKKIGHYDSGRFIPFLMDHRIKEIVLSLGSEAITPERYLEFRTYNNTSIIIKK